MQFKSKVLNCRGPFTSQKTGRQFYALHVETPSDDADAEWSVIRWQGLTDKPYGVGSEIVCVVDDFKGREAEGRFHVKA